MGAEQSRQEEPLWRAVKAGDEGTVKALHGAGASLECLDRRGRTPLMVACEQAIDMSDMVQLLLTLGANPNPTTGLQSSPLHHAAERGHANTVALLLSYGADAWAVNQDGSTPLDVARAKEHASVVRVIEGKLCLFSGTVREAKGGNGFLDVLVPELLTKKVWVVVLPAEAPHPSRPMTLDLVIYQQTEVSMWTVGAGSLRDVAVPRTVICLEDCQVSEPTWDRPAPVLVITHRTTKTKHRFLSDVEGDRNQLEALWRACRGSPKTGSRGASSSSGQRLAARGGKAGEDVAQELQLTRRSPWVSLLAELAVLIVKSLWHALDMNIKVGITGDSPGVNINVDVGDAARGTKRIDITYRLPTPGAQPVDSSDRAAGRGASESSSSRATRYAGGQQPQQQQSAGRSPASQAAAAASRGDSLPTSSGVSTSAGGAPAVSDPGLPSAPPLPPDYLSAEGHANYPSVDTSPAHVDASAPSGKAPESTETAGRGEEGRCVICWDAPAQAACVPCGHLVGCMDCLSGIKDRGLGCPVCRAHIQQVLRVFHS